MRPLQATLVEAGFEAHHKLRRREQFLAQTDRVAPWAIARDIVRPLELHDPAERA